METSLPGEIYCRCGSVGCAVVHVVVAVNMDHGSGIILVL